MPAIRLDRTSAVTLQKQIYRQIARAIGAGIIAHQVRLPATRVLARILGVSRNTVLAAYDELIADGLLRGHTGAGMRVNGPHSNEKGILVGLQHVIRAAGYPVKVLSFSDGDGNALYIQYCKSSSESRLRRPNLSRVIC